MRTRLLLLFSLLLGATSLFAPGWATIMAMSVSSRMIDSCRVCVLPDWAPSEEGYPYETIVYADVTVKGRPMDGDMVVAAI